MELPTKQNERINEFVQQFAADQFTGGPLAFLQGNLPSLVRSIVEDALPPENTEPHIGHEVPRETPDKKNYLVYCSQWNSYRRAFLDNLEKQGILPH